MSGVKLHMQEQGEGATVCGHTPWYVPQPSHRGAHHNYWDVKIPQFRLLPSLHPSQHKLCSEFTEAAPLLIQQMKQEYNKPSVYNIYMYECMHPHRFENTHTYYQLSNNCIKLYVM